MVRRLEATLRGIPRESSDASATYWTLSILLSFCIIEAARGGASRDAREGRLFDNLVVVVRNSQEEGARFSKCGSKQLIESLSIPVPLGGTVVRGWPGRLGLTSRRIDVSRARDGRRRSEMQSIKKHPLIHILRIVNACKSRTCGRQSLRCHSLKAVSKTAPPGGSGDSFFSRAREHLRRIDSTGCGLRDLRPGMPFGILIYTNLRHGLRIWARALKSATNGILALENLTL